MNRFVQVAILHINFVVLLKKHIEDDSARVETSQMQWSDIVVGRLLCDRGCVVFLGELTETQHIQMQLVETVVLLLNIVGDDVFKHFYVAVNSELVETFNRLIVDVFSQQTVRFPQFLSKVLVGFCALYVERILTFLHI